ncbi:MULTISPECIES: FTR1 family iron permease [Commensalibacter]|uniref:FTR1 family iron permease n=2 Tax=Commensalibacter TaxID=1079922 RepID=W7E2Y0_9PROT|nr:MULTISPECIES: FTR1 family protein [Commensalibacter]EUK17411.1 FTR1 family iron permease [Commensalibacter papalotli (ex Servin-Garciduenas et al. 2014)]CAI3957338.1 High-affinity Fe2+/Pb2+ permease (FTR1) [Commensalibacter papalotli (ex Botero et al. 2024)]CAI3957782.1 High-affinity Fe2+/Pb2+ permease (FTR1) [Commensalibacter papalotli (ex Botero et al. 2024)]
MGAPLFIVWRESVEALLVIGILYAWLRRENLLSLTKQLWIGTGLGLALAGLLAITFWVASNWFAGAGGEWFFTGMMFVASLLILQMVIWMHRHGRGMKKHLEQEAADSLTKTGSGLGILILAMLAVAREGSETVVFLAGIGVQQQGSSLGLFILGGVLGFVLALLTFWLLQKSSKIISWKWFFLISEFLLLLIGGGLMISAFDKAAAQISAYNLPDWLYSFMDDYLWSSAWLIPDNSTLTGLTGYHAEPSLMQVMVLAIYWILAILFCKIRFKNKTTH